MRSIGSIEGNKAATDNDWESIAQAGETAIKNWIAAQMKGRSCTVVMVGENTANRKWINYEIVQSWGKGMGVVGIYVHGLKNSEGEISPMGKNPFDFIDYNNTGKKLSSIVKCCKPAGSNSKECYEWIKQHLANEVEEAISIREDA